LSGPGTAARWTEELIVNHGYGNVRLTPSCTSALQVAALFLEIRPGDEVIIPSYTFVATANAFACLGAKIVFADSLPNHPNIDCDVLEALITPRTKAVVLVHYAGMSCDMKKVKQLCAPRGIAIVDDSAHSFFSKNNDGSWVGMQGDVACFSFHDTKNISCGEGGMISWTNDKYTARISAIRNKGTNREAFEAGQVPFYEWTSIGGSFILSELQAAFLHAQVEHAAKITELRKTAWDYFHHELQSFEKSGDVRLPLVLNEQHNAHIYYLLFTAAKQADDFMGHMKKNSITCALHYYPLHESAFGKQFNSEGRSFPNAERFKHTLVRIPVFSGLTREECDRILSGIRSYFRA